MTKKVLTGVHLAFWFYCMVVTEYVNDLAYGKELTSLSDYAGPLFISNLLLFTFIFYFNYLVLLPRFFKKKKFIQLIFCWFLLAIAFVALRFLIQEYLFSRYLGICNYCYTDYVNKWSIYAVNNFFQGLSNFIMTGTIIWFVDDWFKSEKLKIQLQKEKVDAERAFLQTQVSPHFLFNSLNNIYSMVYHGSTDALPAIQKLSMMMRYIIAESHSTLISLSKEIAYLGDYIQLQQYRSKDAAIRFVITGEASGKYIAPLILIAFVENAFKHGIATDNEHPITIEIDIRENSLLLHVSNRIDLSAKDSTSGIGLKNIESRLSLQYPGLHTLHINKTGDTFTVDLLIETLKSPSI